MATSPVPADNIPLSVDYTSRDFYALRSELITRLQSRIPAWQGTDPNDFGLALIEAFAYMGDIINFYIDRAANESLLNTATQRQSIINLSKSYGYTPTGYTAASVELTFTNNKTTTVTLPAGTEVSGSLLVNGSVKDVFFTTDTAVIISPSSTNSVSATHGEAVALRTENLATSGSDVSGELLGYSYGTAGQQFVLSENQVVESSIVVYVRNGNVYQTWEKVESLSEYGPTDAVYEIDVDANNYVSILFGDGISGSIPPLHEPIKAAYLVGGGVTGNIAANTISTLYKVPGMTDDAVNVLSTDVTVANLTAGFGGANPESTESIRANTPRALTATTRAVNVSDFANLTLGVSGVAKASAVSAVPGSVTVYFSVFPSDSQEQYPSYDADPSDTGVLTETWYTVQSRVEQVLSDKIMIGTTVTIMPPVYVPVSINIEYTVLPAYTSVDMATDIKNALINTYSYSNIDFKATIAPEDIEYTLRKIPGIATVNVVNLYRTGVETAARNFLIMAANELPVFTEANTAIALRSKDATLSALTVSSGTLSPTFASGQYDYTLSGSLTSTTTFTPTATAVGATTKLWVNGVTATNPLSTPSGALTTVSVIVTAPDKYTTKTYTITVDRT
jgi:hypothetical protein